jgi:HK97 family phage major capsid protein
MTYGEISMVAKKLVEIIPVSEEMLMDAINSESRIQTAMLRKLSEKMDYLCFNGTGVSTEPVGLYQQILGASNNFAANATTSLETVKNDLKTLLGKTEDLDIPVNRATFFMHHRTKRYLTMLSTSSGDPIFPAMQQGSLLGYPYYSTNQIPKNEGVGSDESKLYHVNAGNILLGTTGPVRVDVIPYATYLDSSGTMVSGVSTGRSVLRVSMRWDMVDKFRGQSGGVCTGVKWA